MKKCRFLFPGQLGRVRESLGLCPQHDVLFDNLTVEEHLEFFGALKGATPSELKFQIPDLLEQLQLDNKRTAKSKTLSGINLVYSELLKVKRVLYFKLYII